MDKIDIQQELGATYSAMKNNGKIKPGCAFALSINLFEQYTESLGLNKSEHKGLKFLGVPIIIDPKLTDEILFIESQFDLDGIGTEAGVNIHASVAEAFRNQLDELKKKLINKLELEGISFQNDTAFTEFARTQLVVESHEDYDVILYEGKEFLRVETKFKPFKNDRNN